MDAAVYASLAELLDYPGPGLAERVEACAARLEPRHARAASRLRDFGGTLAAAPRRQLQEGYAATFDLDASCSPHVGYRLLGPDPRRGVFLARLAARYRARGFSPGRELPDHVAVVLRFLAHAPEEPDLGELVCECLVPALETLARELARRGSPYAGVAEAIRLVLEAEVPREAAR